MIRVIWKINYKERIHKPIALVIDGRKIYSNKHAKQLGFKSCIDPKFTFHILQKRNLL